MLGQGSSAYDYGNTFTSFRNDLGDDADTYETSLDDVGTSLYRICNEYFPPDTGTNPANLDEGEMQTRKAALENAWSMIRRWFKKHPDMEDRRKATSYVDQYSMTPLHLCCKSEGTPYDIIEHLVRANPNTVRDQEHQGELPLHYACAYGLSLEVLTLLCDEYPEGKLIQDRKGRTALHFTFFRKDQEDAASDEVEDMDYTEENTNNTITQLVDLLGNTGASSIADEQGLLPMHYACAYGFPGVLQVLYEHNNACIHAQDTHGRTPVHYAMSNARNAATPRVLRFLLQAGGTGIIKKRDSNNNLPIHLLVSTARVCPDRPDIKKNIIETMKTFFDTQPKIDADMFGAIQSLPTWIRDHVVTHSHMQTILNRKAAKPHHFLLVFVDLIFHFILIAGFEASTLHAVDKLVGKSNEVDDWSLIFLISSAAWFLFRELLQICGLLNLGKVPFRQFKLYFNIAVIGSIIASYALIEDVKNGTLTVSVRRFTDVIAIFKLLYYINFIFFIRSFNKTFAIFVSGIIFVLTQLWPFLITLSLILLMFSFAFHFLSYNESFCQREESLDTCKVGKSLLRMLTMMMGEIGDFYLDFDTGSAEFDREDFMIIRIFYLLYAVIVVLVLSNMLIAITTESYGFIKDERATMVFWSNRLDQVASNDAVFSLLRRLFMCEKKEELVLGPADVREHSVRPTVTETDIAPKTHKGFQGSLYHLWEELIGVFSNENMDAQPNSYCNVDFILLTITRIIVCIAIPLWLLIGVASLSVLWPPQIRERIYGMEVSTESSNTTDMEIWSEFDRLKKDMMSMRKKLKDDLKMDRAEIDTLNFEVFDVQKNVLEDIVQVKEIMTSLLDQMKTELANRQNAIGKM